MRRFLSLLKRDLLIAHRNYYVLIVVIIAFIIIGIADFVIPEKLESGSTIIYSISDSENEALQPILNFLESNENNLRVSSREEVIEHMKKDRQSIGIVVNDERPPYELIFQGYENTQSINALILTLDALQDSSHANYQTVKTKILKSSWNQDSIPFNKSIVPLMILNEPVMLGFALLATLIFMEKEERTWTAYRTTPGKTAVFLLSKILIMILLGLMSTILITIFTIGIKVNWLLLIITVIVGIVFGSTIAMFLGSFFNSIAEAMVWILGISILFTAPMISYFIPGFAPKLITMIPTYNLMFAFREIFFPSGNTAIVYGSIIMLTLLSLMLFGLSVYIFKKNSLEQ